jgi:hypothetical protein
MTLQEFIDFFLFKIIFCSVNVNCDSGRPWRQPTQCTKDVWIAPAAVTKHLSLFQTESSSALPNMATGAWFPNRAPRGWVYCHCNLQAATRSLTSVRSCTARISSPTRKHIVPEQWRHCLTRTSLFHHRQYSAWGFRIAQSVEATASTTEESEIDSPQGTDSIPAQRVT